MECMDPLKDDIQRAIEYLITLLNQGDNKIFINSFVAVS